MSLLSDVEAGQGFVIGGGDDGLDKGHAAVPVCSRRDETQGLLVHPDRVLARSAIWERVKKK
jgi:hypothetical protein